MKPAFGKTMTLVLAFALLAPAALLAQKEDKDKERKEVEQIIITLKGDKKEKVMVEVDGDNIKVNGKPLKDLKDEEITVKRQKIRDRVALSRVPGAESWNFNFDDNFNFFSADENRAMLGVVTDKTDKGAEVQEVTKESAAEKAGLKKGDIITKINDTKITGPDELTAAIKKQKPGDKVTITFLRDKKEQKVTAELTKWKGVSAFGYTPGQNFRMEMPELKMQMDELRERMKTLPRVESYGPMTHFSQRPRLGMSVQDTEDGKGVKVIEVDKDGHAQKSGIKVNDIITEIDGKPVKSADEVAKIVRESRDKTSIMVKLQRDGKTQNIEVKIPKKLKTADL
jgi:serine protease Do